MDNFVPVSSAFGDRVANCHVHISFYPNGGGGGGNAGGPVVNRLRSAQSWFDGWLVPRRGTRGRQLGLVLDARRR